MNLLQTLVSSGRHRVPEHSQNLSFSFLLKLPITLGTPYLRRSESSGRVLWAKLVLAIKQCRTRGMPVILFCLKVRACSLRGSWRPAGCAWAWYTCGGGRKPVALLAAYAYYSPPSLLSAVPLVYGALQPGNGPGPAACKFSYPSKMGPEILLKEAQSQLKMTRKDWILQDSFTIIKTFRYPSTLLTFARAIYRVDCEPAKADR